MQKAILFTILALTSITLVGMAYAHQPDVTESQPLTQMRFTAMLDDQITGLCVFGIEDWCNISPTYSAFGTYGQIVGANGVITQLIANYGVYNELPASMYLSVYVNGDFRYTAAFDSLIYIDTQLSIPVNATDRVTMTTGYADGETRYTSGVLPSVILMVN